MDIEHVKTEEYTKESVKIVFMPVVIWSGCLLDRSGYIHPKDQNMIHTKSLIPRKQNRLVPPVKLIICVLFLLKVQGYFRITGCDRNTEE
jgi:hypothetical protein